MCWSVFLRAGVEDKHTLPLQSPPPGRTSHPSDARLQPGLRLSPELHWDQRDTARFCGGTPPRTHLSGVEVDEAVASRLPLQRSRLMEQEVKLLHMAKLLQQLHQVVPAGSREQV